MTGLVAAELLKLRTTRTFWGLMGATLALVVLVTGLTLAFSDFYSEDDVRSLLSTAGASGIFLLVLGGVVTAGEYRHGTIAWTLLVTPRRARALLAQVLACAAAGLVVGLVAVLLTAAIGLPWLQAKDAPSLSSGETVGLFAGCILYTSLAAALGAGAGSLLRNQVGAVVLLLVVLFVVDPAAAALADDYARYSLSGLATALTGAPASDAAANELLPFWAAALVWTGYTALVVGAAAWLTSRRDV
jgi:ABC-2 type transport system permease protein